MRGYNGLDTAVRCGASAAYVLFEVVAGPRAWMCRDQSMAFRGHLAEQSETWDHAGTLRRLIQPQLRLLSERTQLFEVFTNEVTAQEHL